MRYLTALTCLLATAAHASPVEPTFGTQRFTPGKLHTVTGPLVQFKTAGGSTLSFQQGAQFSIDDSGAVTLHAGNLRVGPAGTGPITINAPQGPVTVAPLTALTITAQPQATSGRIYQGNLIAENRTFTTGEGFILTPTGARGTFTPAPAQAPALLLNLADIEPTAGPGNTATPPTSGGQPLVLAANTITPPPQSNPPASLPSAGEPQPEPEITPGPQPEPQPNPEPETQQPAPEPEPGIIPEPQPEPEPIPQPQPEPTTELPPTPVTRSGLYAALSEDFGPANPTNSTYATRTFNLSQYANGTLALDKTLTGTTLSTAALNRGTAENLDIASHGTTSGLGRWVGGELTLVTTGQLGNTTTLIDNYTPTDGPTPTPNSIHYVWGQKPTATPTSGRVEYSLFAATQPTYVTQPGAPALASTGGSFTGSMAINFAPGFNGVAGTYHLNGTVTMPQTMQTETGPVTAPTAYAIATPARGVIFSGSHFNNNGTLNVTAPADAIACPGGTCSGTVNAAGFGAGMKDIGATYAINPGGDTAITGAALFTSAP